MSRCSPKTSILRIYFYSSDKTRVYIVQFDINYNITPLISKMSFPLYNKQIKNMHVSLYVCSKSANILEK